MNIDIQTSLDNIRFYAKCRGMTLGELEQQMGVSRGYLSRYLSRGWKDISVGRIMDAARILGVSVESIMMERDNRKLAKSLVSSGRYDSVGIRKTDKGLFQCYIKAGKKEIVQGEHETAEAAKNELDSIMAGGENSE